MKWFKRSENTSILNIGGTHVVTIKKRKEGTFPYYFAKHNNLLTYSGGFGTMESAKKHVEIRVRDFARAVKADSIIKNWNDEGLEKLLKLGKENKASLQVLHKSIDNSFDASSTAYFDNILKRCDEAERILNTIKKKA